MTQSHALTEMRTGASYKVVGFTEPASAYAEKLRKMGFTKGTPIQRAAIAIHDPIIVLLRGSQIALRKTEAKCVLVEACPHA